MSSPPKPGVVEQARAAFERARTAALRASLRISPTEAQRVLFVTILLGGACGLVAVAFHQAIAGAQRLLIDRFGPDDGWIWIPWVLLLPVIGGLIAGAAMHWVVPNAIGSGIPQVKAAYALDSSGARFRDAIGKFLVCTLQLGAGASLGREGPTVQVCAGVATGLGRWFALSPANLRRLIPVGAAAGIAAAFNAPIAAVTFTIEEVVGTLDQTVLSGVVVAAALAAVVEHSILGTHPVFESPGGAGLHHASSLLFYALLGVAAAIVSVLFTDGLVRVRAGMRRLKGVPPYLRPALGGLITGALAVAGVLLVNRSGIAGGGYATLSEALHGRLVLSALVVLGVLKMGSTIASFSSGGAGGFFAPTLFIGAMLGGLVGELDVTALGHAAGQELPSFALVGMGAVFAGVIRAPITSVLIIFEMTGGYELVLPLMIANMTAYMLARKLRPIPIYEALLAQDGITLPEGAAARGALSSIEVQAAMTRELVTLPYEMPLTEAVHAAAKHGHSTYPVLAPDGRFVGLLSEARMQRTIAEAKGDRVVGEVARGKEHAAPDEPLLRAVARMNRLGVRQLPVLARGSGELVGMLAMSDVLRAQLHATSDPGEHDRMTMHPSRGPSIPPPPPGEPPAKV